MTTSSRPPLAKSKAWSFLITNLFVFPGLGSVLGKRHSGWFQMAGSLAGAIIILIAFAKMVLFWIETQQMPQRTDEYLWLGLGLFLFLGTWLWSLFTSIHMIRSAIPDLPRYASAPANPGR